MLFAEAVRPVHCGMLNTRSFIVESCTLPAFCYLHYCRALLYGGAGGVARRGVGLLALVFIGYRAGSSVCTVQGVVAGPVGHTSYLPH